MSDDQPIVLTLTLKEVNGLLVPLTRMPYIDVVFLISKIQTQVKEQINQEAK